MNKRGQVIFFSMMMCVVIIVLALALAAPTKTFTDGARNTTDAIGGQGLDCSNTSISSYDKGACILTDLSLPYFILGLIGIGAAFMGAKLIADNV